jgi:hypothetical protein
MAKAILLVVCLLAGVCGGCARYYRVSDPGSGKVYYTHTWMSGRYRYNGAVRFHDLVSGSEITLQSSEVREVKKEDVPSPLGGAPYRTTARYNRRNNASR